MLFFQHEIFISNISDLSEQRCDTFYIKQICNFCFFHSTWQNLLLARPLIDVYSPSYAPCFVSEHTFKLHIREYQSYLALLGGRIYILPYYVLLILTLSWGQTYYRLLCVLYINLLAYVCTNSKWMVITCWLHIQYKECVSNTLVVDLCWNTRDGHIMWYVTPFNEVSVRFAVWLFWMIP